MAPMNSVKLDWGSGARVLAILGLVSLAACHGPAASSASAAAASGSTPSGSPSASSGSSSSSTPASNVSPTGSNGTGSAPAAQSDSVTLSWAAPTENTDGSALTNLAGFDIYYGNSAASLTQKISIGSVGLLTYVVPNLNSGTWYFEVVAVNAAGVQSGPSSVVSVTI
jgi:hypothetical protein